MRTDLRVIRGGARKAATLALARDSRLEWIADVHLFVHPLLVVVFFWWLAYGHR